MNDKIKRILEYTGIIGSIISAMAYILVTLVIVLGFESAIDIQKQLLFAILGAFTGLMITFGLRSQGVVFAAKEPNSKAVMKEYYDKMNKKKTIKQLKTIKHYLVVMTIGDFFLKGLTMAVSTYFILYIFMEGSGDFALLVLAAANLSMFISFGVVALSKAYDKYLDEHIPAIREIIIKLDQARSVALEREEHAELQQRELPVTSATSGKEPQGLISDPRLSTVFWG